MSRFAELFNIEQSSASQWKKGRQLPRPQIQYKIALFFEVTWDELMTINIQEEYIKNKVAGDYLSSKEVSPLYEEIKKKIKEIEERICKLEDEYTLNKI